MNLIQKTLGSKSKFLAKLLFRFAKISQAGHEKIKNDNEKYLKIRDQACKENFMVGEALKQLPPFGSCTVISSYNIVDCDIHFKSALIILLLSARLFAFHVRAAIS
jgi:hypothetical protein